MNSDGCAAGAARACCASRAVAPFPRSPTIAWCCEPEEHLRRHAQRGLRDREQRRRRVPARQRVVAHPEGRARQGLRRGRGRRAADAFRSGSAKPPARSNELSGAVGDAARRRRSGCSMPALARRWRAWLIDGARASADSGASSSSTISWTREGRARRAADAGDAGARAVLRRDRAACSSCCIRRSAAASTGRGAWRCASGSAASSTSSCRRRRTEDAILLSLGAAALVSRSRTSCAICIRQTVRDVLMQALLDAPRVRARGGDGTRPICAGGAARTRRTQRAPQLQRMLTPRICWRRCSRCGGVPREHPRRSRGCRIIRWSTQTVRDCLRGGDGLRGPRATCCARIHSGEFTLCRRDTPEPSPLAHGDPERQAVCLPGRRAARGAARARGRRRAGDDADQSADDWAVLDAAADRARARGGLAADPRDADELHDALMTCGVLFSDVESRAARAGGRAGSHVASSARAGASPVPGRRGVAVAAERLPECRRRSPGRGAGPPAIAVPPGRAARDVDARRRRCVEIVRGRLTIVGPDDRARPWPRSLGVNGGGDRRARCWRSKRTGWCCAAASRRRAGDAPEWCDRGLPRAHPSLHADRGCGPRSSRSRRRDFMRFLFAWQHVDAPGST